MGEFFKDIWKALSGIICWGLWKERNMRIFEDKFCTISKLTLLLYKNMFEWASIWASFDESEWDSIWREEF